MEVNHEDVARQDYMKEMQSHTNFECTNAGLMVNPLFPHLGASPDGFVHCDCCGKGLLEIKCPFTAKDIHPNDLRGKSRSCFRREECNYVSCILHTSTRPACHC